MQTTKTAWEEMGYSWRDGTGTHRVTVSLAYVDPFQRATSRFHRLDVIACSPVFLSYCSE